MSRPNYAEMAKQRIEKYDSGTVFGISDFADIADSKTLHMILKRMTDNGKLLRIMRGIYMKPRYSTLLKENIPPRISDIAEAIARSYGWSIVPSGATALNILGLSTQVPANYEYISDGPYKTYEYDGIGITFKHTDKNTELTQVSDKSAVIIQALKAIGKDNIDETVIRKISAFLSPEEKEAMIQETKHCTSWIYELIKLIYREEKNV